MNEMRDPLYLIDELHGKIFGQDPKQTKSEVITIRLRPNEYNLINSYANYFNRSKAWIARKMLEYICDEINKLETKINWGTKLSKG